MAQLEQFDKMGEEFITLFYSTLQTNRGELGSLYYDQAILSYEGTRIIGKENIQTKYKDMPWTSIAISGTVFDVHPNADQNGFMVMVTGQLIVDGGPQALGFTEVFVLKTVNGATVITNQIFRLMLHNS